MVGVRMRGSLAYLGGYVVALGLGLALIVPGEGLSMFAPAAGAGALWMLRGRNRPEVALDAGLLALLSFLLILLGTDFRSLTVVAFTAGNLVQALGVRLVCGWLRRQPVLGPLEIDNRSPRELLRLAFASVAAAVASAPLIVLGFALSGRDWDQLLPLVWVVRNTSGAIAVMAAVLAIRGSGRERIESGLTVRRVLAGSERALVGTELALAVSATLLVGAAVFVSDSPLPLGFLVIATSAWIGFRFAPLVAGGHTVVLAALALVSTVRGTGTFGAIENLLWRGIVVQLFVATAAMITLLLSLAVAERRALADRLRVSEARAAARATMLDTVAASLTSGVSVVDADGRLVLANPASRRLLPVRPADPEHRGILGLFRLDRSPVAPQEMPHAVALAGHTFPRTDLLRIDPVSGAESILAISALPLDDIAEDGRRMALVLARDVTSERTETRELQAFAAVVAHDLGNPLYALTNWAEVLDGQLDDLEVDASAVRGSLLKIYRSAEQMRRLINDLLLLTRTSTGDMAPATISLDEVIDSVAAELVESARGTVPCIGHGPLGHVLADPTLVRQVVANLVGNAVKYVAPGDQPLVRVTARPVGDMIEVSVDDNGVGIPATDRSRVFDTWYRSASTSEEYPGTGLGLSITATAVERHGGTISARAGDNGTGTTVIFTLPLDPEADQPFDRSPAAQRLGRTTSADPPPRRTGSDTAVS